MTPAFSMAKRKALASGLLAPASLQSLSRRGLDLGSGLGLGSGIGVPEQRIVTRILIGTTQTPKPNPDLTETTTCGVVGHIHIFPSLASPSPIPRA